MEEEGSKDEESKNEDEGRMKREEADTVSGASDVLFITPTCRRRQERTWSSLLQTASSFILVSQRRRRV